MSPDDLSRRQQEILRQVEELKDASVPDPGPLYWQAFPGRLRQRLAATPAARRWVPWAGMAAAASLLLLVWIGGRTLAPAPLMSLSGETPFAALDGWEDDQMDDALDLILGAGAGPAVDLGDLNAEEKQTLLESLRGELSRSSSPTPAGQGPA